MKLNWNLFEKKVLVTGGTKGIGRAITEEFLELGAEVIVCGRDNDNFISMFDEIKNSKLKFFKADVSIENDRKALIEFVAVEFGSLDVLVNNAGTNIRKRTMDYTDEEFRFLLETNLISVFDLCKLAYPILKASGKASIVNISSVAASGVVRTGSPYAAGKAGVSHLTKYLAVEWAADGIRANAIEPWYIRTPLTEPVLSNEKAMAKIKDKTPMGRIGEAAEIAGVAAFLCMPGAGYVTGQCIQVDGGASALMF